MMPDAPQKYSESRLCVQSGFVFGQGRKPFSSCPDTVFTAVAFGRCMYETELGQAGRPPIKKESGREAGFPEM